MSAKRVKNISTGKFYTHPSAEVSSRAKIGDGAKIWHFAHVREDVEIGKNCVISKGAYIDHGVKVGNNVKIQNGVSVYYGVTVEDDVLLAPNVTLTNDLYPRAFSKDWTVMPTLIKKGASVGANATIICGVTLGEYCMVAAGSVITKSVPAYGLVMGNPGRLRGFVCKCGQRLGRRELNSDTIDNDKTELLCKYCGEMVRINLDLYRLVFKDIGVLDISALAQHGAIWICLIRKHIAEAANTVACWANHLTLTIFCLIH